MNYRKFYKETTGVEIPKGFDVHHIDGNRSNNDIMNLVAIPRNVHRSYHFHEIFLKEELCFTVNCNPASYNYHMNGLTRLSKSTEVIHYFIMYRNSLIGILSNSMELNYNSCLKKYGF